ncbi:MAG: dihydroorotate dehydrogenase electron transfer subunit, partial [Enterococcus gallinarum]|nr:dihydroorotate dehydrogenase electron transfer subunit [Enterococcus gallinarum]
MKQERMTITKQRMLAPRIYEMTLSGALVQEMTTPGQFLHIRVPDDAFLLRRPISISWIDQESQSCRIIYRTEGEGTKRFAHLQSGDQLDVLGPLGNGFHIEDLQKDETVFIVGGGIGVPPLYELSKQLVAKGVRTIHFLGFASSEVMYYEKAFQALGDTR